MTAPAGAPPPAEPRSRRAAVLVWIDGREAVIVRWADDGSSVDRVQSAVPAHRRSTSHVRHDPMTRHGGGGAPQTAGEPHRLEHLERFVEEVADRLASDDDVVLVGPGTVYERLETHLRERDSQHGRSRAVSAQRAGRLSERQLVARLRAHIGASPRRRVVGA